MASITKEIGHSNVGIGPWSTFFDQSDDVSELSWPANLAVFDRMRTGDVQIAAVLLAGTLPIRRYKWFIEQEGASDEVTQFIADNLSLPVKGKDPEPAKRRQHRFSHDFHLRHALLALVFGHAFFEQVYAVGDDGLAHIRKLAPRMQKTISEIETDPDGGLKWIRQFPAARTDLIVPRSYQELQPTIPVDRLVAYVNDREGSHWQGRSVLRPVFRNWTIKDKLMRVDAIKHERNGLGVPTIEAPQDATQNMLNELSKVAQAFKVGGGAGAALPYGAKLRLVGTEGSLPDTLASIRYQDEQMALMMLEMFMKLGTTETGSRALGDSLIDFFHLGQVAIAKNYADTTTEHVIEDLVDLNWGTDEPAPRIGFEADGDERLAAADLAVFVDKGLVVVDEELQEYVREAYNIDYKPNPQSKHEQSDDTTSDPDPAEEVKEAEPEEEQAMAAKAARGSRPVALDGELSRDPFPHEVEAGTDFGSQQQVYDSIVSVLVSDWTQVRDAQLDDLTEQIEKAGGDLEALAAIAATALGADLLTPRLVAAAQQSAAGATGEAVAQGVVMTVPEIDQSIVEARAKGVELVMARAIGEVASRKAIEFTSGEVKPAEVAAKVRSHIEGLTDAFVEEQMGGAVMSSQNLGRFTVYEQENPEEVYASEIRDKRTCGPCKDIDGKKFDSLNDAHAAYPVGGYVDCRGGSKCRGTPVGIWNGRAEK